MKFFKVTEIRINDEKDKYYITSGNDEKEIQLNKGFTIIKSILDFLYNRKSITEVKILIQYIDEILDYYFVIENENAAEFFKRCAANNCLIEMTDHIKENNLIKNSTLTGAVHPIVINDRDYNFIDELIKTAQNRNFSILISLKKDQGSSIESYKKDIADKVKTLSSSYLKNISKIPHIGKNIQNTLAGGEGEGYSVLDITEGLELELLKDEYNCLSTQGSIFMAPEIVISAEKMDVVSTIKSQLISFSLRSGVKTKFKAGENLQVKYCPSSFVAAIIALPTTEVPGILLNKEAEYGSDISNSGIAESNVTIGKLFKNYQTDIDVKLDINDLRMHAFVTGVTGSGKTSTIKKILWEAYSVNIPFLVLEPAKSEYRNLAQSIENLKRFTLGIEGEYSFKLNPFFFPEGIHIQTHLDNLKSVFIAAFPMYGPMPYILETALYKIYKRTGWDLISSTNIYSNGDIDRLKLFPTLEDLYLTIDEVMEGIGYSNDLKNDVRGALKVRIGSLMTGAKGLMLNTCESNSISDLMQHPTVMELENIGDPQEKVFLMGLILISIYEHYVSIGKDADKLNNILVIEEAHRLLENSPALNSNEIADMKGKALETFNNILSEIRAYGQGIIIADQIPAKLSPDVIKNTNLKIVHRLFAKDDRDMIGNSIGLEEEQIKGLIHLSQGEAVIFHSRLNNPLKTRIIVSNDIIDNRYSTERIKAAPLKLTSLVMLNEGFVNAAVKIISLHVLFPKSQDAVIRELRKLLEEYYPENILKLNNIKITEGEIINIFKDLLIYFIKQIKASGNVFVSYIDEVNVISKIRDHNMPYDVLLSFLNKITSKIQHKIAVYCDCFTIYSLLSKKRVPRSIIDQLIIKYKTAFVKENISLVNNVLKFAALENMLDIDKLSVEQRSQLCSAVLIDALVDEYEILEYYFSVGDGTPNCNQFIKTTSYRDGESKHEKELYSSETNNDKLNESLNTVAEKVGSLVDVLSTKQSELVLVEEEISYGSEHNVKLYNSLERFIEKFDYILGILNTKNNTKVETWRNPKYYALYFLAITNIILLVYLILGKG